MIWEIHQAKRGKVNIRKEGNENESLEKMENLLVLFLHSRLPCGGVLLPESLITISIAVVWIWRVLKKVPCSPFLLLPPPASSPPPGGRWRPSQTSHQHHWPLVNSAICQQTHKINGIWGNKKKRWEMKKLKRWRWKFFTTKWLAWPSLNGKQVSICYDFGVSTLVVVRPGCPKS